MRSESRDTTEPQQKRLPKGIACHYRRRGVATIWVVGFGPALLVLLVLVTEISSLWLARIELETAVESGALSCVAVWGSLPADTAGNRTTATAAGVSFAQANTILGNTFTLAPNPALFGSYVGGTLTAGAPGTIPAGTRAVVFYATVTVPGLWNGFGGARTIRARATARFDAGSSTPRLVRVATIIP